MRSKIFVSCSLAGLIFLGTTLALKAMPVKPAPRQFYQLIIYHLKGKAQEARVDQYLSQAYVPAAHRAGIKTVGVFKSYQIDTVKDKMIYVLLPFLSLKEFHDFNRVLETDKQLLEQGSAYLKAPYNDAPFIRKESMLMEAFSGMPELKKPAFSVPKNERVYELRSYEGATELLNLNKIQMFNKEEVEIFDRIGSQPVFYAQVLAGSHTPNLMYLTTYSSMASREEHWKTFSDDPKWKRISALPEYQHNTSKADITFVVPAEYSDL